MADKEQLDTISDTDREEMSEQERLVRYLDEGAGRQPCNLHVCNRLYRRSVSSYSSVALLSINC